MKHSKIKQLISRRHLMKLTLGGAVTTVMSHAGLPLAFAKTGIFQDLENMRLPRDFKTTKLVYKGQIPAGLKGTFFKNGPATPARFLRSPHHPFDGDGFVQAFRFDDKTITHQGSFVATGKYVSERDKGDLFIQGFDTRWPNSPPIINPDDINPANINIIHHGNKLLALWEAGSAWQLDPENLATIGPVTWRADLAHLPFSAHPKCDADGSLWNFGQIAWVNKTAIYHISKSGNLRNFRILDTAHTGMIHDFAITKKYLVLLMPPLMWQKDRASHPTTTYLGAHEWRATEPVDVFILDKQSLEIKRRHQLPTGFHFHIAGAFERDNGEIELTVCNYKDASILWTMRQSGAKTSSTAENSPWPQMHRVMLPATNGDGHVAPLLSEKLEFPRMVKDYQPRKTSLCWALQLDEHSGLFRHVRSVNLETGASQSFDYGVNAYADEHVFIAKPHRDQINADDGWLIGTHFDLKSRKTILAVFDALYMDRGPILTATLPYAMPPGLHGNFVHS